MKAFKYTYDEDGREIVFQAEAEFVAIPTLAAELGCGCEDCQRGLNLKGDFVEVPKTFTQEQVIKILEGVIAGPASACCMDEGEDIDILLEEMQHALKMFRPAKDDK